MPATNIADQAALNANIPRLEKETSVLFHFATLMTQDQQNVQYAHLDIS